MKKLFSFKVPLPKHHRKKKSDVICTLNNISTWKRSETKIKKEYKDLLRDLYIPEPDEMYESLIIDYRILRHNKRRLDKDNVIFSEKWLSDLLEDMGYVDDDKVNCIRAFPTIVDMSLPETMIEFRLNSGSIEW